MRVRSKNLVMETFIAVLFLAWPLLHVVISSRARGGAKLGIFLTSLIIMHVSMAGDPINSCVDLVRGLDKPGATDACAPPMMSNQLAFEFIESFSLQKIGYNWYLFGNESSWNEFPTHSRWEILAMSAGAVQSLYGSNADVYLALMPTNSREKIELLLSDLPVSQLKGIAEYNMSGTLAQGSDVKYPAGTHHKLYTLIVYP